MHLYRIKWSKFDAQVEGDLSVLPRRFGNTMEQHKPS